MHYMFVARTLPDPVGRIPIMGVLWLPVCQSAQPIHHLYKERSAVNDVGRSVPHIDRIVHLLMRS